MRKTTNLNGASGKLAALLFMALCIFISHATYAAQKEQPLKLGFFPIISTVALYKRFSPLRDYLAEELGRDIELLTAKDFPTFVKRTDNREYDIVVTAPHFTVRAIDSGKYIVRAATSNMVQQLFVVKNTSEIAEVSQLAGKIVATPPPPALMTLLGKQFLVDAKLTGDKAPQYRAFTSHNAANKALLAGEVDAAIASSNVINQAIERGEPIKIAFKGLSLPSMGTLVASDLDSVMGERIQQILANMNQSNKGKAVLKQISFPGYKAVTAEYYEPARPFMEQADEIARKNQAKQ